MKIAATSALLLALTTGAHGALRGLKKEEKNQVEVSPRTNDRGIDYPSFRFTPWCSLNETTQLQALDLSWDEKTWNAPGTAKFEMKLSFATIVEKSIKKNDTIADSLIGMGWTEPAYDCYVNHYEDYNWKELEKSTDTVNYWKELGWNSSTWEGDIPFIPDTDDMDWDELSEEQRAAARALCYFEELWNFVEIPRWEEFVHSDICVVVEVEELPVNGTASNATMVEDEMEEEEVVEEDVLDEDMDEEDPVEEETEEETSDGTEISVTYVPNPSNRFLLWSWLFDVSKEAAATLGFDEETWNQPMSASVESLVFDDLSTDQIEAAYVLGLAPAEVWDCHVNHYTGYNWDELEEAGVQQYLLALGWTYESWTSLAEPPQTEGAPFATLTEIQKAAARSLCYREPTWNKANLADWVL